MIKDSALSASFVLGERILWQHSLFGRLTKSGKEHLLNRHGWNFVENDAELGSHSSRLAFIWPSKSGPQFEMDDDMASHIRPFPKHVTDVLDDKIRLAQALAGTSIAPKCICSPDDAEDGRLYFVKHRFGAQGKSVYVYNKKELHDWWVQSRNRHDFVLQEEIRPALFQGRKFVLRSHILLIQRSNQPLEAYLHKSVICQHHATCYDQNKKSSHISQAAGKQNPDPVLLDQVDSNHPAVGSFHKIEACSMQLSMILSNQDLCVARDTTCFALLGTDLILDSSLNIQVCEVNSHPALGWGTMSKVPSFVFSRLVNESLDILLGISHRKTNFNRIL